MIFHIIIGILTAVVSIFLVNKFKLGRPIPFWERGLILAALIYVGFAIVGQNWEWLPTEFGGVAIYGMAVLLSRKFSPIWLAIGWAGHILWDLLLHPNGHPGYIPDWYPGVCLGFDIVIGVYIFYYVAMDLKKNR